MKLKTLVTYSLLASFCASTAFADDKTEKTKLIPNMVSVKIEVGEFFGLFDRHSAEIKIVMPAKNAYGFQGKAMTDGQQSHQDKINDYLTKNSFEIVKIEGANCTYVPDNDQNQNSDNSEDVENVEYVKIFINVKCDMKLSRNKVDLNFTRFSNIQKIKVKLEGFKETQMILNGNKGTVVLK